MAKLTAESKSYLSTLRNVGMLQDVKGHKLDSSNGLITVMCPDCDQFESKYEHLRRICKDGKVNRNRIHPLGLNGGAIRLSATWSDIHGRAALLNDIMDAVIMKDIHTVVLMAHAPCGAAGKANWTAEDVVRALMAAKTEVKEEAKKLGIELSVASFFHVDWNGEKKNTYFISRDMWLDYTAIMSVR